MEKLTIKNFGPIKEVEIEIKQFTILIGEQATGKSTIAKLLSACRYFSYIIEIDSLITPPYGSFHKGLVNWGLSEYLKSNSYIHYQCNHYNLTVEIDKQIKLFLPKLEIKSDAFKNLYKELQKIKPKTGILHWTIPTSFFSNDVASVIDNPYYIYTERGLQSVFSLGKNSIPNISDSLFNYFEKTSKITSQFIDETIIDSLDISYKNVNGKGLIRKHDDDVFLSLATAASGYQSAIPIVLLINYYTEFLKKGKTFIIEEPEQNLSPTKQYELIKFFARKQTSVNSFLLTTHSPYILSSLNNLMYAFLVGILEKENVNNVIDEKYWINPDIVSAYKLNKGYSESIISEDKLIKAEEIDTVSRIINEEFDKIQDIELSTANDEYSK